MRIDFVLRKYTAAFFLIGLLALAAGCSPIEKQAVRLANANGCCHSLDQVQFKPLESSKETEFKISEESPTFQFEDGKSYFAAYALPQTNAYTKVAVKSTVQDTFIRDTEQIFCPSLMFIDENKQILGKEGIGLRYSGPGWISNPYWFGAAHIPSGARYIIFYTRAEVVGKSVARSAPSAHSEFVDSNGQKVKINVDTMDSRTPCGQVGELAVVLH